MNLAIVTGITGFLGSRLAAQLLAKNCHVIGLKRSGSPHHHLDFCGLADRIEMHDVDRDGFALGEVLKGRIADAMFHTAALSRSGENAADLAALVDTNIKTPLLWVKQAKQAGVRILINTSTSWQSVTGLGYAPFNVYAATKESFEHCLMPFVDVDFTAVSIRLFDTYGAGDTRNKIVDLIARAVMSGEALAMSPGEQSISLVHIDDVARAFIGAAELAAAGQITGHRVYNLPADQPINLRDLAAMIGRLAGCDAKIVWGGRSYRPNEVMFPHASHPTVPAWRPHIALEDGLRGLLAAYRKT